MMWSQRSGKETCCSHLQAPTGLLAHLHFVFEKQRSLVCASGVRRRFCMPLC